MPLKIRQDTKMKPGTIIRRGDTIHKVVEVRQVMSASRRSVKVYEHLMTRPTEEEITVAEVMLT